MRYFILAAVLAVASTYVRAADYTIDADHSAVGFKVKHLVGKVAGRFTKFSGSFSYDPKDPASWKAEATIDPSSINTDNERRDKHLNTPDFFDTAKCPAMSFKSVKVSDVKDGKAKLSGDLTMHCATKPIVLDLEMLGVDTDPWGNVSAGFSAQGTLNRKDYGISWNKTLDSGSVFLGEDIEIQIEIAGMLKKAEAPAKK